METPEFFQGGYCNNHHQFTPEKRHSDATNKNGDHFIIEDLLDFPNDDGNSSMVTGDATFETTTTTTNITGGGGGGGGTSAESSTVTAVDNNSYNSSSFGGGGGGDHVGCRNLVDGGQFSGELCVPYDDLAELEWLSNFVEESFSSEDLQKLQLISGMKARTEEASATVHQFQPDVSRANSTPIFRPEMSVPAKARSKRSRAAPCNWTSRLLVVSSPANTTTAIPTVTTPTMSSSSESDIIGKKIVKGIIKKKENSDCGGMVNGGGDGRKCLHCATDKTPQWRTGPMGPKTLCNACGVRYKSGRLVPEYRPAASPTFVLTKHSNSHRKVLEIRRQKDMVRAQQQQQQLLQQSMMFDVSNGEDYLIHQHIGPDFRQLI